MDDPLPVNLCEQWEKFFSAGGLGRGANLYPGVFANNTLFPLQRMRETEAMIQLARSIKPRVIAEIGADKGGSFFHWVCGLETVERALAVEIRGTPYGDLFAKQFPGVDFKFIPESSYSLHTIFEIIEWLGGLNGEKFDCVFLDGDKGEFLRDFNLYRELVRPGGLIMMHDVNRGGPHPSAPPADVFDLIAQTHRTERIVDTSEVAAAVARKQPLNAYDGWLKYWRDSSCGVGVIYL